MSPESKIIQFGKEGFIDPEKVKENVYNRIDFDLPLWIWEKIDSAFAECWNNEIGIRGYVYVNQIEKYIYNTLKKENILLDYQRVKRIVKIIFDYIEMSGGFLEEKNS
jgi:hypothetical protein